MDSSPQDHEHEPQRLSALYQYHNAPEVAPAHGLEYDDSLHPASDKYPVIREHPLYQRKLDKHGFASDNRPPRIIFGMKVQTFLVVASVMILVVVGAAVGGAVGGQQLRQDQNDLQNSYLNGTLINGATSTTSSATTTSTFMAATPTYTPLSDCPASNNTGYTSSFSTQSSSSSHNAAGLKFTKYCDFSNPLATNNASQRITEAFVYTFSDCIEVCAGYNYWNDGSNCTIAVYQPDGDRPGNCWVGNAQTDVQVDSLTPTDGTDVAILKTSSS